MTPMLKEITKEIATGLVSEFKNKNGSVKSKGQGDKTSDLSQMFLSKIAEEVVRQMKNVSEEDILKDVDLQVNGKELKEGLDKAEEKLSGILNRIKDDKEKKEDNTEKDIEKIELDDLDDTDLRTIEKLEKKGYKVIYPNLKYNKPKYQNVSEMLKYVESDNAKGEGVKLVIMNFND